MPRKRANPKPLSHRSHHGCQRCRLHKIRCDEVKPSCGSCTSRGYVDCSFLVVLKWEADYRHVGRAFGRTGVWSKAGKTTTQQSPVVCRSGLSRVPHVHQSGFLNLSLNDFDDGKKEGDEEHLFPLIASSNRSTLSPGKAAPRNIIIRPGPIPRSPHDPLLENLHLADPPLVSYYLHRVCPLSVPSADYTTGSPFSALLLPFALSSSSPALLHALLGLAASHRARFDSSFNPTALSFSNLALRSLRTLLASKTSLEIAVDPETLVLMMLLCQTELIKDGNSHWVIHLRGARNLMSFRRRQQQLSLAESTRQQEHPWEPVVAFAERFFAFCDVMGRTACGEEPIFGNDFWSIQESKVDLWMGCSPHLVSIISTIAELSWKYHGRSPSHDEQEELESQRNQLQDLLQQPDLGLIAVEADDDGVLRRCVELKRLTVDLYLHAALANTTPVTSTIRQRVQKILRLVYDLLHLGVKSGLAWPLFMAACQLDPEEELEWTTGEGERKDDVPTYARPFILYALEKLSESLFNVDRTRAVIEKVWMKRESSRLSRGQDRSLVSGAFNDWARFVAPLCHNISLA
ncbi:fungal-specific transcription factor domain-containing protein [Ilyonectria destructans]|nr:fungal-specific transcription factor domain-containing protein [Ilyonectria destructans]